MQNFREIGAQDYVNASRTTINNNFKTIQSQNAGDAFPTSNLFEGMKCYRTDLKKTYTLKDVELQTWVDDTEASTAESAEKLAGLDISSEGHVFNSIPVIQDEGAMEIGKYLDFHCTDSDADYTSRFTANTDGSVTVGEVRGTFRGEADSAGSVSWDGIINKPTSFPASTHNHDSSYPSKDGSRATGTWGINVTGAAAYVGDAGGTTNKMRFNWTGQSGQPTWLWGGNDRDNMYVYNPANFNVKHAATADSATTATSANSAASANAVAWANVSGKPGAIIKVSGWDGSTLSLTTCT